MSNDNVGQSEAGENEPRATDAVPPRSAARNGNALARLWQWFWRADAMRELSRAVPAEHLLLVQRARVAADVARRVQESPEPFEHGVDAILCDLYRQSIHWSLSALRGPRAEGVPRLSVVAPGLLQKSVADADLQSRVERAAAFESFEDFEHLPEQECASLLVAIRRVALALVVELETDKRAVEALWTQRFLRIGLLFALFGTVAFGVIKVLDGAEQKRDLAIGAPWRTSSVYSGASACHSPEQDCTDSPEFFFHTQDEQGAWIEFDLRTAQQISGARVDNRSDCCAERATPMVIEVSTDQQRWKQVARQGAGFSSWSASFAPVRARWVRFRLEKKSSLHLRHVRILR